MAVLAERYELLAEAGRGGMGTVYRGRDLARDGRCVAVKVLDRVRDLDVARFEREASLLAAVRHANIVDYVDHGVDHQTRYLVLEWIDGVPLAKQLAHIGITAAEAVAITTAIARGLAALHGLGIVHRDVKPANILLVGEPAIAKLLDFGIARKMDASSLLTQKGMIVGTPSYMAPEQQRGDLEIEASADIWALGCVLFEALTGYPAYSGKGLAALRAKVVLGAPPELRALCPEAPPELLALIREMLAKDPAARPRNGAALVARLEALPAIASGPRRRLGLQDRVQTVVEIPHAANNYYVMLQIEDCERAELQTIGDKYDLQLEMLDDGMAIFASRGSGRQAARDAVSAAVELRRGHDRAALSVVAREPHDTVADAIDRGSVLLERATLYALFGATMDEPQRRVFVDDTIAQIVDEPTVIETPDGRVVVVD